MQSIKHAGVGESGPTITWPALPLDRLKPAPWNPRRHFDETALTELAADIAAKGILQPLVVRDLGDAYEIVCGHRRFIAAGRAGLAAVPAVVRALTDREALEAAISENGKREGLHPLEEADGYLSLHTTYGEPVEEIAARFGVPASHVHQRLSLARLCTEGRDALLNGKLLLGAAVRIARIPSADHQREAVKWATSPNPYTSSSPTVSDVGRWIESRFHLRLSSAPFDRADPSAPGGACDTCPKTSDAQRALFGDEVADRGVCLDPVCFAAKRERVWQIEAARIAEGRTVLSADVSLQVAPRWEGTEPSKGYVDPTAKPHEHAQGRKTWRELLGTNMPQTVIARGPGGKPIELIEPEAFKKAVAAAGIGKTLKKGKNSRGSHEQQQQRWREQRDMRVKVSERVYEACSEALAKKKTFPLDDGALWQFLAMLVMTSADGAVSDAIIAARNGGRGPRFEQGDVYAAHRKEIAALTPSGCRQIIFDLVLEEIRDKETGGNSSDEWRTSLATLLQVDVKAIEKKVHDEFEAAKKPPPAKPAKKPTAKKPTAKKPAKKGGAR